MPLRTNSFANTTELNQAFASQIMDILAAAIQEKGRASIAVSGGSTPKPLFQYLSNQAFAWDKVDITLVDERWVDATHQDSNEKLVRENLMINLASKANFISLTTEDKDAKDAEASISKRIDDIADKFDVLILGMGEDGHTASLFPCSSQLEEGFNLNRQLSAIATMPTTAPHQRMSMSLAKIIKAHHIFLHLTGDKKKQVLQDALTLHSALEKPIKAVCDKAEVTLMWAP